MSSLDAALRATRVRDIMTRDVATIAPEATIEAALSRMVAANVGSLLVTRHTGPGLRRGAIEGLLPVFFALRASVTGSAQSAVGAFSINELVTAGADETIGDVLGRITDNRTWRLIAVDGDEVVGVISATDIVRLFARTGLEVRT
jgi:CBS domain-containing protein